MQIDELPSPYKELAELRYDGKGRRGLNLFCIWEDTPEGYEFWFDINFGEYPEIPKESLEELKQKGLIMEGFKVKPGMIFKGEGGCRQVVLAVSEREASVFDTSNPRRPFQYFTLLASLFDKANLQPDSVYKGMQYCLADSVKTIVSLYMTVHKGKPAFLFKTNVFYQDKPITHEKFWVGKDPVPEVEELTMEEVCRELGREIKIKK